MAEAAASTASSINQEQLLHELESKYLRLQRKCSLAESECQSLEADKRAAVEEAQRIRKLFAEREDEACQLKQQLLKVTTEKDALTFKLETATSVAERRLSEIDELQTTVREHSRLLVEAQRREMQALERAAKQEAQVATMTHAVTRAQKEAEAAQQHSQWFEEQLAEKIKTVQELRHEIAKHSHDLEELKIRSTEELTSAKRQLESARLANKKLEGALIKSKEALKELQAAKIHDEEALENELNAQRRLAKLYQESAAEASARVTELQSRCDGLLKSLSDSEQALAHETERTKAQVEHLFREQAEASEARIQALQDDLERAEQRIKDLEAKKIFSLQTASAVADLSPSAGEVHLAAHGLTAKQMYDHILELEETLQAERTEKDQLQVYMERILKEVQEKAPVLKGLRLDLERTIASHTQVSERLEKCMQELAKSKSNEQEAFKEKKTLEKKCETLRQSVDDLSKQVQHLLFRSHDTRRQTNSLDVGSENLVVFKDVEELQVRNQQLLAVIRELTEMNKAMTSDNVNDRQIDADSTESTAHWIITGDSDDELDQVGATIAIKKRLSMARKELQNLRAEREQEREMITAIVKQRDMYRVLLAQSDMKFIEGDAVNSSGAQESAATMERPSSRHGSVDVGIESEKLREVQKEFEDYKMEKQASVKLLQEALEQERSKCTELRLAQMQAQVEATCSKERCEASEERCKNLENELVRLRSKADQLSSLILQHQQMVANTEAKLEASTSRLQSLAVEKDSAVREAEFLRKNEENVHAELTTLRHDNTNLLKLMESTRRMESAREERERREVEALSKKVVTLETKLYDAYEKIDVKEAMCGAQVVAAEREKQAAVAELTKLKERHSQLNEQHGRVEEQKKALEEKSARLEKETTQLRDLLRKGAGFAASERVAALEVELRDAQREVQASLVSKKTLIESVTKYKVLAEASEKNLEELSSASEKWKQHEAAKVQALERTRDELTKALTQARVELKEQVMENNKLREEMELAEKTHKQAVMEATEKQQLLQVQVDSAVQQMKSVREEMSRMKRDLETVQENYERELQLHAAEVSKSSACRREMELLRTSLRDREAEIETLNTKTQSVEKEAQVELELLQKRLDEVLEAKTALVEQNSLLHSQLERAAAQVRRAHEQELLKGVESHASMEAGEGSSGADAHAKEVDELRSVIAYLRREYEIAEAKLELAQQEVQRGRAEIVSLKSSVERLRGEMKALCEKQTSPRHKAETLTKQLGEKNKEIDDRTSAISSLEMKLSSVQAQIHTVTTEKAALETKLTACETAQQESLAAASGGTASWEKERLTLKAQLELETKKSTQLKDLNARLMSGLKNLKKENNDLKDQNAANAAPPVVTQEKTPVPSPPPSPLVPPSTTTMTTSATPPTQSATLAPLFASAKTEPPEQPSSAGSVEATGSKPGIATSVPAISSSQTGPVASIVASTTSAAHATTESSVLSTAPPAVAAPVQVIPATAASAPVAAHSTEAQLKQVIENPTETDEMSAEEKLRFFALRSIKKQVGSAARLTAMKPPTASSDPEAKAATEKETEATEVKQSGQFKFGAGTGLGAFGSGGPSGLVFGKPGISLPVPSSPSSHPPPLSLAQESAPPEALRRSQRLARFGDSGETSAVVASTTAPSPAETGASTLTKRPLSTSENGASVAKVAKKSEDQTPTMVSEGKQEEDTPPAQADSTGTSASEPTH
ncbi:hypothetical protein PsorP6_011504 [Peronosclerospora sorghi]|uniref:Uncharacterized protein n=1 Tax=Peronosclerospora sorghi TaxID=230839 RepID=A0ACC0WJA8_9STRA|nr:hypothetical protein PsorP6_011504 [Peronosclerospora sorghi]